MDFEFSGGSAPASPNSWITINIEDTTTPNTVLLTIANTNLVAQEFNTGVYLNLVDAFSADDLFFALDGQSGSFALPTINTGVDDFKSDGDGYYDIYLAFSKAKHERFGAGESVRYRVSGPEGLDAKAFNAMSAPGGGHGPYLAAARVQGVGANANGSGWVAPSADVPEPATILLLASAGTALLRRKR